MNRRIFHLVLILTGLILPAVSAAQDQTGSIRVTMAIAPIADIQSEDNLFDGVDLLALSACDTAMSNNGKESESFAYVAQDLGAKTVLASLWPVSDVGTPELMTRFCTLRSANPTMTKGEAFHRAQLSLVRGEKIAGTRSAPTSAAARAESFSAGSQASLPLFAKDARRPFAHPFYWSPFILIGNWR